MELQKHLDDFRKRGLNVAALSYDSPAVLKNFAERRKISFPLLSDPESKVIRAFGILNEKAPRDSFAYGVPYPGTYILDRGGVVTAKYFEDDYTERTTAGDILVRQFGAAAGGPHQTKETAHLRITASASAASARPGQKIALVLDVELKPKMHVYAPGVEGYKPVVWEMEQPAPGTVSEPQFPKPIVLHLKAIGERVPVFEKRLRVTRDFTLARQNILKPLQSAGGDITIRGVFRYQACDDKICYLPQSVPVEWTLRVEPHDSERAPAELRRAAPRP